jgi:3-oxoacyl-[acyl-carrier-protein] synthase-1
MASMRPFADLSGDALVWHPADCIGDAGAGLGALNFVWTAIALARGYSPTDRVLVWGASDGAARAAALLAAPSKS